MDTSATPQPLPRLRVSRASPSSRRDNGNASVASSSQAGPSRLTEFTQLVDLNLSDIRATHAYTDEDEDEDQYPTPRMTATSTLAPSATPTPSLAGRLRELIHLVPNGSGSQATPRPPSPTFHESDFEGESAAVEHSQARGTLRNIFSKALREPGDTPQKGRQRRNSDSSANESDVLLTSSRILPDVKGKRKSFSDEESDNPLNLGNHGSQRTDTQQHTILRPSRDTNALDFPLKSLSAEDSDDAYEEPHHGRHNAPNGNSTTLQSLRISHNSSFPQHSNLMDQDSEMHRAFGEVESSDEPSAKTHHSRVRQTATSTPSPTTPSSKKSTTPQTIRPTTRKNTESSGSFENQSTSTAKPTPRQPDRHADNKGRDTGHRRTSLQGSTTPALRHQKSSSSQFSDHSSAMSVSDYGERMKDMEQERNREREREWNKPHPKHVRPGSSLSFNSTRPRSRTSSISSMESPRPGSALSNMSMDSGDSPRTRVRTSSGLSERPRTTSTGSRPGSALSNDSMSIADFPQNLRRHHSLTNSSHSPAISRRAESEFDGVEVEHERERNWNAPRPKWHRRSLPNTPDRPASPGPSKLSTTPQSPADRRRLSTTPTTALQDTSNTTRSGSSLTRRHSQPKVTPHSPSPAERRIAVSPSISKSPHSRLSTTPTSSPANSRLPVPGQSKSRLPIPSVRTNRSGEELREELAPKIQVQDEVEEPRISSSVSFPQAINGQSRVQESMEFTEAYNGPEMSSAIPSFSDASDDIPMTNNDTMHTASLLGPNDAQGTMYQTDGGDEDNYLAQERTPTLQTIDPPADDSNDDAHEASLPLDRYPAELVPPQEEEEFEPGSLDFPPSEANQSSSIPSFLSTPPRSRHSSFNSSKPEFQTPSPPKGGLPDLPGPPSGDETEEEPMPQFNITPAHIDTTPVNGIVGHGDVTTFKTPKPPGAWLATPGPSSAPQQNQDDSTPAYIDSSDDGLLQAKTHSQSIFPQTPAAPGGWAYTPAAGRQRAHSNPQSTRNEGGLTTPVASIGRANTLPLKTPAPPGGWINTPGAPASSRKSVLKVRFDPDVTSAANGSSDILTDTSVYPTKGASASSGKRPTTPEPVAPATPPSRSPRKHKRSPSVRVVDAYGNAQKEDDRASSPTPSTPRSRSGIRIVDGFGQEVTEETPEASEIIDDEDATEIVPMTRLEALQRVRQGIQELADGIESLDWSSQARDDHGAARIKELDDSSRALKQSREQIAQDMHKAEKKLRRQAWEKVRVSSFLGRNGWFLLCVALIQIVLIFIMYRASVLRARKLFLTNYYDPFNPDLFLYTTNPDTQYAAPATSWSLVIQGVRSGDVKAFTGAFRDNLSILLKRWHQQIWDVWGDDPTRGVGAWPPT